MASRNILFTAATFVAGLFVGLSALAFMSFTSAPAKAPAGSLVQITATDAHTFFMKYMASATPLNQVVKGFTLDRSQLDAMDALARENTELAGFRIYMGLDNSGKKIGIVVGVDITGKDALKNSIFNTDSKNLSPCPLICDVTSPIILEK